MIMKNYFIFRMILQQVYKIGSGKFQQPSKALTNALSLPTHSGIELELSKILSFFVVENLLRIKQCWTSCWYLNLTCLHQKHIKLI